MEITAVLEAVRRWATLLRGQRFVVVTDHRALEWLFEWKDCESKFALWALELEAFDFTIKYRPGAKQGMADALSRLVDVPVEVSAVEKASPPNVEAFVEAQRLDELCRKVRGKTTQPSDKRFVINQLGVLCFIKHYHDMPMLLPVVPRAWVQRTLQTVHEASGHRGSKIGRAHV